MFTLPYPSKLLVALLPEAMLSMSSVYAAPQSSALKPSIAKSAQKATDARFVTILQEIRKSRSYGSLG